MYLVLSFLMLDTFRRDGTALLIVTKLVMLHILSMLQYFTYNDQRRHSAGGHPANRCKDVNHVLLAYSFLSFDVV